MYTPDSELRDFVQSLPKTETHLHLEGACPLELIERALPGKYQGSPPMWDDAFRYRDFEHFMEIYAEVATTVFNSAEAYHQAAKIILGNCAAQNCRYVETSFHLGALLSGGMSGPELVSAVLEAAPDGLEVRVFMGICHDDYHGRGKELIDDCKHWEELAGLDLHGPEYLPLESWTAKVWRETGAAGKELKAHAGEFMPASFVRRCVDELGVRRIQHGVRSIEDPSVVDWLIEKNVTLDVCPISNIKLQVDGIPRMSSHPIRQLFDAGVRCTVNSDDPFMFGNTLSEEYYALASDLNFTRDELARIASYGFEATGRPVPKG